MVDLLSHYANMFVGLLLFYLLAALPSLLVWWLCRFRIWIGLKILVGILAIPPTALFLFWLLYFSVAVSSMGVLVLLIVWIVFGFDRLGCSPCARSISQPERG